MYRRLDDEEDINDEEDSESTDESLNAGLVFILTNGIPPLHFACMHPCTLWYPLRMETLLSLRCLVPQEQWLRYYHGKLPFHYACRAGAPKSVLKWCEMQYPDAIRLSTTDMADTPLHCYLSSWSYNRNTLATTGTTDNMTLTTRDMIDIETKRMKSLLLAVQYLIKKHRVALYRRNRQGYLPLHVAAMCDAPLDVLFYLARGFPEPLAAY